MKVHQPVRPGDWAGTPVEARGDFTRADVWVAPRPDGQVQLGLGEQWQRPDGAWERLSLGWSVLQAADVPALARFLLDLVEHDANAEKGEDDDGSGTGQ